MQYIVLWCKHSPTLLMYRKPIICAHNYAGPGSAMLLVQMKSCLIKSCRAVCCDEFMQLGQRGCEREKIQEDEGEAETDQDGEEKVWWRESDGVRQREGEASA